MTAATTSCGQRRPRHPQLLSAVIQRGSRAPLICGQGGLCGICDLWPGARYMRASQLVQGFVSRSPGCFARAAAAVTEQGIAAHCRASIISDVGQPVRGYRPSWWAGAGCLDVAAACELRHSQHLFSMQCGLLRARDTNPFRPVSPSAPHASCVSIWEMRRPPAPRRTHVNNTNDATTLTHLNRSR